MTKEEIISMLSKELNSEWTNGVTCLMVENSDSYIPVIVHHNKNELMICFANNEKNCWKMSQTNQMPLRCRMMQQLAPITLNV